MSRIWKQPVKIPSWVKVEIAWNKITVTWTKWALDFAKHSKVDVKVVEDEVVVSVQSQDQESRWLWWLTRTMIANLITWVTKWYEKQLEIQWVWYRAAAQWANLNLTLWFSHPVTMEVPKGLTVKIDEKKKNIIIVSWIDKQAVWQFAAEIREWRKPEPYKWKGIRYVWEYVQRKAGKSAAK